MPIKYIRSFIGLESAGGIILFLTAVLAILLDNSFLSSYYQEFINLPIKFQLGGITLSTHLLHFVNDGLMVIFFLLVGLEIKRELIEGELNSISKIVLPGVAALGGMIMPALIFIVFNYGDSFALRGWAIPAATDIAFSLGILSLLGPRIPISLKIFLMALAIFDDIGAIFIIGFFYNKGISTFALGFVILSILFLIALNRLGVKKIWAFLTVGFFLWLAFLYSGIHPTLAGVVLALLIPLKSNTSSPRSPAKELEHRLHPWVAFIILPIFAFANAGVSLQNISLSFSTFFSPVFLGISLGLLLGKLIGVFSTTFLAVKLGFAKMPSKSTWIQILGISLVCGVGFTMSFFVGSLAYPADTSPVLYSMWVRLGVMVGSFTSGLLGYLVLRMST